MNVHNLDRIFKPRRIALIGVTANPNSVGGTVLRNLVGAGFAGVVYPVNPDYEAVLGIPCYGGPGRPAASARPGGDLHAGGAGAGPGARLRRGGHPGRGDHLGRLPRDRARGGRKLERLVREEQRQFDGMRIIGPNCLGVIVPRLQPERQLRRRHAEDGARRRSSRSRGRSARRCSTGRWTKASASPTSSRSATCSTWSIGDLIDYFGEDDRDRVDHPVHRVDQRGPPSSCPPPAPSPAPSRSSPTRRGASPSRRGRPPRTPGRWPARTPSTTRRSSPRRHRAGLRDRRDLRLRRAGGPPAARRRATAPGDRHQRRRAGRDGDRRPDRLRRHAGRARRRDDGGARRGAAAVLVARQSGRRAGRRAPEAVRAAPRRSCWPTPGWTRCW